MSDTITITRALAELKLLDSRIKKKTEHLHLVDVFQNRKNAALKFGVTKEVFEANAKADIQAVEDLIERRKKIKSAILISNATAKVKIGSKEYAVIEAIERKNSISYEKELLSIMRRQITHAKEEISRQKPIIDENVRKLIEQGLGGDRKPSDEDYNMIAKPYLEANELNLLDPCDVEKRIEKLDEQIDNFLTEVDFVLSESNSRTKIEI